MHQNRSFEHQHPISPVTVLLDRAVKFLILSSDRSSFFVNIVTSTWSGVFLTTHPAKIHSRGDDPSRNEDPFTRRRSIHTRGRSIRDGGQATAHLRPEPDGGTQRPARRSPLINDRCGNKPRLTRLSSEPTLSPVTVNLEDIPIATYFQHFRAEVASSPLYVELCPLLGVHPIVHAMCEMARPTQRRPNLVLAALHASVLRDPAHPLAGWFATVGGERSPADPELPNTVDHFLRERREELTGLIANGATQTNEVGRSAILKPALGLIHRETDKPLGLVEIGCSAALNLRLDAYRVIYRNAETDVSSVGPPDSSVHIVSDTSRSLEPLPFQAMNNTVIGSRTGGDLNPLDPADEAQARWLRSLIWPDEHERFNRLSSALALAPSLPIDIITGDAVDIIGTLIESVPDNQHAVVLTTWVLTYLSEPHRVAFVEELKRAASRRPVSWVCVEHPFYCPGLPWPDDVKTAWAGPGGPTGVGPSMLGNPLVVYRLGPANGAPDSRWIATVHPHGRWINWHPTTRPAQTAQ